MTNTISDPAEQTIDVEIWGPPGNGKSVLLVSLVETLREKQMLRWFEMTNTLRVLRNDLIQGKPSRPTQPETENERTKRPPEEVSFDLTTTDGAVQRVRVISNAGEDLFTARLGIDVRAFVEARSNKVFVACLNPFKIDAEMAWKGLNHLIAVLQQGSYGGMDLPTAFEKAVWTLFQVAPEDMTGRGRLSNLLSTWRQTRVIYDPLASDPANRYVWDNIDQGGKREIGDEMRKLIRGVIATQGLQVDVVWQAMEKLEHSVVVLTHVDLIDALLPSITFTDIERVYNYLFKNRPERMVSQQAVARLFDIALDNPYTGSPSPDGNPLSAPSSMTAAYGGGGGAGAAPQQRGYESDGLIQTLRSDGAIQLVDYLKAITARGLGSAEMQVSRLRAQLAMASEKVATFEAEKSRLDGDLRATRQRQEAAERELARVTLELSQKNQELITKHTELVQTSTLHQGVASELASAKTKIVEQTSLASTLEQMRAQLAEEQALHQTAKANAEQSRAEVQRLAAQLDEATKGGTGALARLQTLDANFNQAKTQLTQATSQLAVVQQEREQLKTFLTQAQSELATNRVRLKELEDRSASFVATPGEELRASVMQKDIEISRLLGELKESKLGRITPDEARQRDTYEQRRVGPFKLWMLFMIRALPVLPFAAVLACVVLKLMLRTSSFTDAAALSSMGYEALPHTLFAWSSLVAVLVAGLAGLGSVILQAVQLPRRWIWLRSMSKNAPRTLEALTSGGERLVSAPSSFTLIRTPLLSLIGIGMIRRNDGGLRYVTSEPGQWLEAPERPARRWAVLLDMATVFLLFVWAVYLALRFN
jgi:hypothetical protein